MKLAVVSLVCCCLLVEVFGPHVRSDKAKRRSPESKFSAPGSDVTLPCQLPAPVDITDVLAVEWQRTDTAPPLTVHAYRGGKELQMDKATCYLNRTKLFRNGSLSLSNVQLVDSGVYSCNVLRKPEENVKGSVSLVVAESADVSTTVWWTSDNKMLICCESRGWNPEPRVSVLGARGVSLSTERNIVSPEGDSHFTVQACLDVAAAKENLTGNGTVIFRVEIPGLDLAKETSIYVRDDSNPQEAGLVRELLWSAVLICIAVGILLVFWRLKVLTWIRNWISVCAVNASSNSSERRRLNVPLYTEHGDINRMMTSGASELTARANSLFGRGVDVSREVAKKHLRKMKKYQSDIMSIGRKLNVDPALIAAIISRQSEAGDKLENNGYGKLDPNCFGLMQINKCYHAVKGDWFSAEHIDEGVTYLIQLIKKVKVVRGHWNEEQQLKGALACYVAGEENVFGLQGDVVDLDEVTPYQDFTSDVIARAQYFSSNGYQ